MLSVSRGKREHDLPQAGELTALNRAFVSDPYLALVNYTNNYRRYGYTDDDLKGRGSDRLIDGSVLHGSADRVAAGLRALGGST